MTGLFFRNEKLMTYEINAFIHFAHDFIKKNEIETEKLVLSWNVFLKQMFISLPHGIFPVKATPQNVIWLSMERVVTKQPLN